MSNLNSEIQDFRGTQHEKPGNPYTRIYRELVSLRREVSMLGRDAQELAEADFMSYAKEWSRTFHLGGVRRERGDKGKLSGMYL